MNLFKQQVKQHMKFLVMSLVLGSMSSILFLGTAQANFLPPDYKIDPLNIQSGPSNMTEEDFNELAAKVNDLYAPIVKENGGTLKVNSMWSNDTINASASQMGSTWTVNLYGGLARYPQLTKDGFTLVACHELGHHLAGFPFVAGLLPYFASWAASEGQSDYYATHHCAKKMWSKDTAENSRFRDSAPDNVKSYCNQMFKADVDQNLCYRTLVASQSLANTLASLMGSPMPSFETPDPHQVKWRSDSKHPAAQCRLDTTLQGALCLAQFDDSLIPGKKVKGGRKGKNAEKEAAGVNCTELSGFDVGLRPGCWFKSRM